MGVRYLYKNLQDLINGYNKCAKFFKYIPDVEFKNLSAVFTMIQYFKDNPISTQEGYINDLINTKLVHIYTSMIRKNDTVFPSAPENLVPVSCTTPPDGTYKQIVDELDNLTAEFRKEVEV
jgi:hypothetical protein